ncbi:MAG: flagellar hook-associated protein FlgK [Proteobacteria bacterium]|nr:flagellar hook-associated protein FlgK [Pseudomonadota bacterium]
MSLLTTIQAARRGIAVASEGINVVAHNTANAMNENYARRSQVVSSMHPLQRGGHWLGQGAKTLYFRRNIDIMLEQQLVKTHGEHARFKKAYETTRMLEARLADGTSASIIESYDDFMNALRQMRDDPSDIVFRDQVVMEAEQFTSSVRETTVFMEDSRKNIRESVEGSLDDVNQKLDTIAEFNKRIRYYGSTMAANDLMDQRDAVIAELSQLVGVQVYFRPDNQATVYIDNHAAVLEGFSRHLEYSEDADKRPVIAIETDSGHIDITDGLDGVLKGKIDAYDSASSFVDGINLFVDAFGTQFNTIHSSGHALGQSSSSGLEFFSLNSTSPGTSFKVNQDILDDVTLISAALSDDIGDSDNLTALIELDLDDSLIASSYTPMQYLSKLYADVASSAKKAEMEFEVQDLRMQDMFELRSSVSGVDLDEEASKLIEYQASYEAASRVLSTTNQMLRDLMNIV